eukprot:GHVS01017469.1.p1 GENE.GHVS01017469.1~~GHVS01017469.1.p1  ORF type:complete len:477 (-),score=123.60 GHVS01017469.1:269-1699(-)
MIFDWDDTLMPSTWLSQNKLSLDDDCHVSESHASVLSVVAQYSRRTLEMAEQFGYVVIVTNAEHGWVELSCKKFMPSLSDYLPRFKILSARSMYESEICHSPFMWKQQAFRDEIDRHLSLVHHNDSLPHNVVSLGDSTHERHALLDVCRTIQDTTRYQVYPKSIKFLERPNLDDLKKEHDLIVSVFQTLIHHTGDLDLCIRTSDTNTLSSAAPIPAQPTTTTEHQNDNNNNAIATTTTSCSQQQQQINSNPHSTAGDGISTTTTTTTTCTTTSDGNVKKQTTEQQQQHDSSCCSSKLLNTFSSIVATTNSNNISCTQQQQQCTTTTTTPNNSILSTAGREQQSTTTCVASSEGHSCRTARRNNNNNSSNRRLSTTSTTNIANGSVVGDELFGQQTTTTRRAKNIGGITTVSSNSRSGVDVAVDDWEVSQQTKLKQQQHRRQQHQHQQQQISSSCLSSSHLDIDKENLSFTWRSTLL